MGFLPGDIGSHSIRKGAVSYLLSLPGGPPAASTCIRAGWTMGKVKDIYMRYVVSGDQFVGRCLSLLSVLRTDFAVSPVHFTSDNLDWIETSRVTQFPVVGRLPGWKKITIMCFACLIYHHGWLSSNLSTTHHCFFSSSISNRSAEVIAKKACVRITFPWDDNNTEHFSGIPPHVSILNELQIIKKKQTRLVDEFVAKVTDVLNSMGGNGGRITEENLKKVLLDFQKELLAQFNDNNNNNASDVNTILDPNTERPERERKYQRHFYNKRFHKLPLSWRIPRCGVFNLWRMWWIGDTVLNVPPLKSIKPKDLKYLKNIALDDEEKHGRTGKNLKSRRDPRKSWSDLKRLCEYIEKKVVENNAMEKIITQSAVDRMFLAVSHLFSEKERDSQMRWLTVLFAVRKRIKKEKQQNSGVEEVVAEVESVEDFANVSSEEDTSEDEG
jgi:hypothetical protein